MVVTVMLAVVLLAARDTFAVEHKVGGALGWNYPPNQGAEYFANWAAQNAFHVGDSLSFEYIAGTHNVVQVDRSDYDACTVTRPMQLYNANKVIVNLPRPGTYYYICGIKGHCDYGMKVALTVT